MERTAFARSLRNVVLEEQHELHDLEDEIKRLDSAIKKIFILMDEDGDGYIDQKEASRVGRALGCNPASFWHVLKKYDAAGNRKLNLEE